ncbi:MAG: M56 family metallopeptidase [Clostridium sp.]
MDLSSFLTFLGERTFFVSITILVLLAIRPLAKKLPRKGMYFLWVILVLRILCPVNFTGIYHLLPAANATNAQIKQELSFGGAMNQYRLSPVQQKRFQSKQQTEPSVLTHSLPEKQPEEIRDFSLSDKLPAFLFILWLSGVFVCVFHLFYSYYRDKKMLKAAVKTKNCCYIHSGLDTPFVFGFFKPRIYIPENTENNAYKFLLAHEKYHIRRQDFRIKPIAFFAFSLLWFNPLGWVAWHLMQKDMEISCDEAVIKQMPFEERKAYSHLLLQMAAAKSRPLCTNAAFGADIIEERILHIMKFKKPTKLIACFTVIAVFLCACGVGSTPVTKEESSTNAPSQKSPDVFVENAINCPQMDDSNYVYYYSRLMLNPKKNLVWLGSKYNKNSYEFVSYMMFEKKENSFEEVETNWSDILNKTMKNRSGYIYDSWYASDESLYVVIMETSMNPLIYNANQEKYKKQYEELNPLLFHISKDGKTAREIDLSALASPNGEKNKDLAVAFIPLSDGRYLVNSLSDDTPEKGLVFAESTDTVVKKNVESYPGQCNFLNSDRK